MDVDKHDIDTLIKVCYKLCYLYVSELHDPTLPFTEFINSQQEIVYGIVCEVKEIEKKYGIDYYGGK